jgi:stage II sporulation protein E
LQENKEEYATLDICQVNLYTGVCEFLKAGACSSYILRRNSLESIALPAMAPGLETKAAYEKMRFRLRPGDYIIMVTDGVPDAFAHAGQGDAWPGILGQLSQRVPKRMSEEILSAVPLGETGEGADDMTVLVAGFWDKQE